MQKTTPLKKSHFLFPWEVEIDRNTAGISYILTDEIRKCKKDDEATRQGIIDAIIFDQMVKLFMDNENIYFFVHRNQFFSHPIFCMLFNITKERRQINQTVTLAISEKFRLDSFKNNGIKETFLYLLYSKENKRKLTKAGLEIESLRCYEG